MSTIKIVGAFPAHAGMNRRRTARIFPSNCVPRACGDEPVHQHFQDMRADLASGKMRLTEKGQRIKTIDKMGQQLRRDIQTARRGIQLTYTDPDRKKPRPDASKTNETN